MKRLALLVPVLLVVLGLSACGNDDDAVVTVNDEVVLTQEDWEAEMEEFAGSDAYLDAYDARGTGGDATLETGEMGAVLRYHVIDALYQEIVDQEGIEVTSQDRETGIATATSDLANPLPESGNAPLDLEEVPPRFREVLTGIYINFVAALRHFGATPEAENDPQLPEAQERLGEVVGQVQADSEVEIAGRYGGFDAETGEFILPMGPIDPPAAEGG